MKNICTFFVIVLMSNMALLGQNSAKGFNFQAVARNADGSVKAEQPVELKISLYPTAEKNAALYIESHTVTTDKFGVFSMVIGGGSYVGGTADSFEKVDFSNSAVYLNAILMDNGSEMEIVHAPFLSVPYAESSTQADNGMPIGAIIPYAGELADGIEDIMVYGTGGTWRLCNGTEYDPAEYVNLHIVLDGAWGTNRLPDLRGMFLRGTNYLADDTEFSDPDAAERIARYDGGNEGNLVGSFQADTIQSHDHIYKDYRRPNTRNVGGTGWEDVADNHTSDPERTTYPTGGLETRPINANVNFIIRVK